MIALLGALRVEISGLRRLMGLKRVEGGPARRLYGGEYRGSEILLAQTGAGRECAAAVAEHVFDHYPVRAVVSLGLAGALDPHLGVGEVVVCSTLHCAAPAADAFSSRDYHSDDGLVRLSSQVLGDEAVRGCVGSGVTTTTAICTAEEKQILRQAYGADVVDMESYWIAEAASRRAIPFVEVRAISDTQRDVLPPFDRWADADGRVQLGAACAHFLRHPHDMLALFRLAGNARRARDNLTAVVDSLVDYIGVATCAHS